MIVGGNPLPEIRQMSFADLEREWVDLPEDRKAAVIRWVNAWRAVGGGFTVTPYPREIVVEPSRIVPIPDSRIQRKRSRALIAELRASPELASAVQLSTVRIWYQAKTSRQPGETVQ